MWLWVGWGCGMFTVTVSFTKSQQGKQAGLVPDHCSDSSQHSTEVGLLLLQTGVADMQKNGLNLHWLTATGAQVCMYISKLWSDHWCRMQIAHITVLLFCCLWIGTIKFACSYANCAFSQSASSTSTFLMNIYNRTEHIYIYMHATHGCNAGKY